MARDAAAGVARRDRPDSAIERRTYVVAAAYALLLLATASQFGTWTDEEYTLATTAHGAAHAWRRAIDFEVQAPLYFTLLGLWRKLDGDVWFARAFSILSATALFATLPGLLRRVVPGRDSFWAAVAIAFNPFVVFMALDIRLYAFALLLTAIGFMAFDAGFASGGSARARLAFVATGVVALYTQYFLVFVMIGYGVALAALRRWRRCREYVLVSCAIGVAALPLLAILHAQVGKSGETTATAAQLLRQTALHPWLEFVLPADPALDRYGGRYVYDAIALLLAVLVWRTSPRLTRRSLAALVCAGTIEAIFIAVVLALRLDLEPRHYVALFVPLVLAAYGVYAAVDTKNRIAGRVLAGTYLALTAFVLVRQYHAFAQMGDTKRVAAYLAAHARPGAIVAVFPADALPAYARQYRGTARLVPFPKALPPDRFDVDAIDVRDEAEATAAFARLRYAPQLWLVTMGSCADGRKEYGCDRVLAAVHAGARIRDEQHFYLATTYDLDVRRPPSSQARR